MTGGRAPERVLVLSCPDWPEAAARAFEPVVAVVGEFCPKVEVLRPGSCAISVSGPARYFGGEREIARKLATAVHAAGFTAVIGVADGLFAAKLAAAMGAARVAAQLSARATALTAAPVAAQAPAEQPGPDAFIVPPGQTVAFLASQPVSTLGSSPELGYLLPRLGITTLGEFAALPAAEAANRFGAPGELAHRLARGLDPRPRVPRPPPADLSARREFDPPAGQVEPVVFAAKSLAEDLHARLAARGLACVRVQIQVHCEDGREISRFWRHDGLLSGLAVAERVRWQLDGWRTKAGGEGGAGGAGGGPAGGITDLRLVPDQLVRATGRQLRLWGDAVVSDRVARAAIRVQAILGHGAVTRPVLAGGRRPADQALLVPFGDAGIPQRPADRPWPGQIPAPSPATVYRVPRSVRITDSAGTAVSVTARAQMSAPPAWMSVPGQPDLAITAWAGPWPVTERWWDPAQARRQARFQLVTEDGSAWLAVLQDGGWLIEASYD
ncbi:MAG: DNA polymerase Y family protein [Streptosporangiaceae bacterium]